MLILAILRHFIHYIIYLWYSSKLKYKYKQIFNSIKTYYVIYEYLLYMYKNHNIKY